MQANEETHLTDGRWRRARVSIELLSDILSAGVLEGITSDAPRDLRVIGLAEINNGPVGYFDFIVWSSAFDPLPMTDGMLNDPIPSVTFTYYRNRTNANR